MSLPHFYLEEQVISQETRECFDLSLTEEDLKHARVMRLKNGEHIAVIDASSDYFECCIDSFEKSAITVHITQRLKAKTRPKIYLAQGLAKGDKMDSIIRHATELGITGFIPLLCKRSIVKLDQKKTRNRMQRWRTLAKSAAMQSGQPQIPKIFEPHSISKLSEFSRLATAQLICWEEADLSKTLPQAIDSTLQNSTTDATDVSIVLVVGPEGGLDEEEVSELLNSHPHSYLISLGPSILRTETAGIIAPALTLYELEQRR